MRKNPLLFILIYFSAIQLNAQTVQWAKSIGSTPSEDIWGMAMDADQHLYTLGLFKNTTDFDPGPGTFSLSPQLDADYYVQKLNTDGELDWAIPMNAFSNPDSDYGGGQIGVDNEGNTIVTFTVLTPFEDSFNLDLHIRKINADGLFVWQRIIRIDESWTTGRLPIDDAGNVYVASAFDDPFDADPGPGVHLLTPAKGTWNMSFIKLDRNGNFVWARTVNTFGEYDFVEFEFTTVAAGTSLFAKGIYYGKVDFDPGPSEYILERDTGMAHFLVEFDTSGNFVGFDSLFFDPYFHFDTVWVLGFPIIYPDPESPRIMVSDYKIDAQGNKFVCGQYQDTIDIDPSLDTFLLNCDTLIRFFLRKTNAQGEFLWGIGWDQHGYGIASSVDTDQEGYVYLTGQFIDTVDFDPGPAVNYLISTGQTRLFILKLTPDGAFVWVRSFDYTLGKSLVHSGSGNIYSTGTFDGTAQIPTGNGTATLISMGEEDIFLQKIAQTSFTTSVVQDTLQITLFPNPAIDKIFLQENWLPTRPVTVAIHDAEGKQVLLREFKDSSNIEMDVTALPVGLYFVHMHHRGMVHSTGFVKM